jgi:hypothetical protein
LAFPLFTKAADAKTQQSQRTRNKFLPGKQVTPQAVNVSGLSERFLNGNLPGQCGKISVSDLDLDRVRAEVPMLEATRNVRLACANTLGGSCDRRCR